jgi:glycosyltransferase involved in cell wall biosynthesis
MRILIAQDTADAAGGVESYLAAIVEELGSRGHAVLALHQWAATGRGSWAANVDTACVQTLGADAACARVRAFCPDVCFSHNMTPLATERRLLDEWPVVKMMHGYFGTCISGLKAHAFPSLRACDRAFGAACLALYVPRRCGQLSMAALGEGYRWASAQRALFGRYRAVVVASRHMRDEYQNHGVPAERLHVLPLFSTLDARSRAGSAVNPATVLFAGRMTSLKGGQALIPAIAHAQRLLGRRVPVIFAGDGPQRAEWQALAEATDVRAEFTGWIAAELRPAVYGRATLVAVPSLWPEPFGLIGLEAASLGIPAVAFDVGGVRDWLEPERNGVLVDPAAGAEGMGAALAALLADPLSVTRLGDEARRVAARMSRAAHVDALEGVLQSVTAAGRRRSARAERRHRKRQPRRRMR